MVERLARCETRALCGNAPPGGAAAPRRWAPSARAGAGPGGSGCPCAAESQAPRSSPPAAARSASAHRTTCRSRERSRRISSLRASQQPSATGLCTSSRTADPSQRRRRGRLQSRARDPADQRTSDEDQRREDEADSAANSTLPHATAQCGREHCRARRGGGKSARARRVCSCHASTLRPAPRARRVQAGVALRLSCKPPHLAALARRSATPCSSHAYAARDTQSPSTCSDGVQGVAR